MSDENDVKLPTYRDCMRPTLQVLKEKGGTASLADILDGVAKEMRLTDQQMKVPHGGSDKRSEIQYRLAWARTHLKNAGLAENQGRGLWRITEKGRQSL